ncbi:MAG: hypothetical protein QF464_02850, partial [Myxococcota bacterium]|nr:hypothetical protein [Myxococcota bacterium]
MRRAYRCAMAVSMASLWVTHTAWAGSGQEAPPPEDAHEVAPVEVEVVTEEAVPEEPAPANERPAAETEAPAVAAKVLYQLAMTAYNEGRFFEAARGFDAAHAALPRPALLLNAARAWEQVG